MGILLRRSRQSHSRELQGIQAQRSFPVLVLLRHFAAQVAVTASLTLADFITEQILRSDAGLRVDPRELLRHNLSRGRCLVLLDGLDEVPSSMYRTVRDKILFFMSNASHELPTSHARVVVTCRRTNFDDVRPDWLIYSASTYSLIPFRNEEIRRYLDKMRRHFPTEKTPELYWKSVTESGSLDMHRTPLILAMSVGLYVSMPNFEIPTSISDLYHEMITALLDRFRGDAKGGSNAFLTADKEWLLRDFVLRQARRLRRIDDFTRRSLVEQAHSMARGLSRVPDAKVDDFVDEIIRRSGLIREKAEGEGVFYFEHRSVQEFLVADALRREGRAGMEDLSDGPITRLGDRPPCSSPRWTAPESTSSCSGCTWRTCRWPRTASPRPEQSST